MDEAEEGQRELGFYTQALAAVKSAQASLSLSLSLTLAPTLSLTSP